jgi:hypothetical protein
MLYTLVFLVSAQFLMACKGDTTRPSQSSHTAVSVSHSIYIEGGVLKVLSENEQNVLFVYIRPMVNGRWIPTGGGGGMQDEPWLFTSAASWTQTDESGEYSSDSPKASFRFLFNGQDMTLTTDTGTYAVRRGGFIVISLDDSWRTGTVKSGIESLRNFDIPEPDRQRLLTKVRKHYPGPHAR